MNENLQRGEPNESGEAGPRGFESKAATEAVNEEGDHPRRDCRVQARREFIDPEEAVVQLHPPVSEGRFVEAVFVVEIRHDVIAAFHHFDGGARKARFVAIDEG